MLCLRKHSTKHVPPLPLHITNTNSNTNTTTTTTNTSTLVPQQTELTHTQILPKIRTTTPLFQRLLLYTQPPQRKCYRARAKR
ncbi:hypothetical protein M0802_000317 [Mischocyttarus mexicanus]|nr:hypothetical protein M0802_000317 [Mischocyttarus mexicanus]